MSYSIKVDKFSNATYYTEQDYLELKKKYPLENLVTTNSVIDPKSGKINWDCPCLGGMAQPPCGEFFKKAFSCFASSETEPKGTDCINDFQRLNQCFRAFPRLYYDEIKE